MLSVDELDFEVRRSARRRTLQLTVDRDAELIIVAPEHLSHRQMREFVRSRLPWIHSKLAIKAQAARPHVKEFVDGQIKALVLRDGLFRLRRDETSSGRTHFADWYKMHALEWLHGRINNWA